jgi:PAS domain S-box-containing protein
MDEKENTRELVVVDVKRYKRVKKALAESEERYRQLFENVPIGIYRTTPDGQIVDSNPALVKMLGYESFAELSKRNLEKEYSNAGSKRSDFIRLLKRDGEVKGLEAIWTRRDGSHIFVRENAKLVRDESGKVFFEGTVEDITQGKLAEEAQRVRTQQIEILNCIISKGNTAGSLADMLEVILDCVTVPLAFDTAAIFIYDPEAKKMNLRALRGGKKKPYLDKNYMAVDNLPFSKVLHGQPVFVDHALKTLPDLAKQWGWRMASSVPLVSKGRVVGALNAASCQRDAFTPNEKNILELIGKEAGTLVSKFQTEIALRESEKYYRTLIDTSPDIIVVMDLQMRMITVNQRFLKVGGYFYDEVIGSCTYDFVAGLDRALLAKRTAKFIRNRRVSGSEYIFKKKDGQTVPLDVSAGFLLDDAGRPNGIIAIGRDISERMEAEAKLLAYQEQLRALTSELTLIEEKERRRIASELHDQIGQNLALCMLKVATLEKETPQESALTELSAVRRLLECSIQDTRSLIFDLSPPVLYELGFQAALEWLAERMEEQFHVPVEFESHAGCEVLENDRQVILFQVVRELLINVGKHSRAHQAKVILSPEQGSLKIQVNDDGVGFDATKVFDPKGQNDHYGFFSMRERLNYLGGKLEVRSKPGQGSQIVLTVPRANQGHSERKVNP